jgi:hypothetical protein
LSRNRRNSGQVKGEQAGAAHGRPKAEKGHGRVISGFRTKHAVSHRQVLPDSPFIQKAATIFRQREIHG